MLSEEVVQSLISTSDAHPAMADEWRQSLVHCMERLTPRQRAVVYECYGARNIKAAAQAVGRTSNALYKVLRHLRERLHECIQKTVAEGEAL